MTATRKARQTIYEAVSLAERFPDLHDDEVIDFINEVCSLDIPYDSLHKTVMCLAILAAYNSENENVGFDTFATYSGISIA